MRVLPLSEELPGLSNAICDLVLSPDQCSIVQFCYQPHVRYCRRKNPTFDAKQFAGAFDGFYKTSGDAC